VLVSSSGWTRRHLPGHRFPVAVVAGESGEQGVPQGLLCNFFFF
jgi:hypothetical protein